MRCCRGTDQLRGWIALGMEDMVAIDNWISWEIRTITS